MLNLSKKSIFVKIFAIFFLFTITLKINNIYAIVKPTSDFYVNDYAGILSEETKNYIINTNKNLYNKTGSQIVVVTVKSLEGESLEEYATKLFRNFGIGDKEKNNGVLLLLALSERQFRVEVGYGLEGVLPDGKTGRIQDEYIIPYLKQDNFDDGIKNGYNAILEIVAKEYNVNVDAQNAVNVVDSRENYYFIFIGMFGLAVIFKVLISKLFNKGKIRILLYIVSMIIIALSYRFLVYLFASYFLDNIILFLIDMGMSAVFLILFDYNSRGTGNNFYAGDTFYGGDFFGGGDSFGGGGFSGRRRSFRRFLKHKNL